MTLASAHSWLRRAGLLAGTTLGAFLLVSQAYAADNALVSITLEDTNSNAEINRIEVRIDNDAAETWTINGTPSTAALSVTQDGAAITVTGVTFESATNADPIILNIALDENDSDLQANTDGINEAVVEVAYNDVDGTNTCTNCLRDTSGELASFASGDAGATTEIDAAAPLLLSTDPENGSTRLGPNDVITLVFSEGNTDNNIISSPDYDFTVGGGLDATLTITPDNRWVPGDAIEFTVDAYQDAQGLEFGGAASGTTAASPFSFTVRTSGDSSTSSSGGSSTVTNSITLLTPEGGETYEAGEDIEITWNTEGTGISYVDITATYNGATVTVANNTSDDGSYTWAAPDIAADDVVITVTGTDLATDIDADSSEAFTIGTVGADEDATDGEESDDESGWAVSPVTGELEAVSEVEAGDYIKGASYSTIYYVDAAMVRHPFVDAQTFLTYEDDFDAVDEVTDATLGTLVLGSPMLPNPGTVLIKVQSIAKVYAMDADGELRWITSETIATSLFGEDWADYVIDVADTLWPRFEIGSDIDNASELDVDQADMKTRAEVNE